MEYDPALLESAADDGSGVFVCWINRQVSEEAKEDVKVVEGETEEKKPEQEGAADVKPEEVVEEKKEEEEEDNVSGALNWWLMMLQLHVIWSCKQVHWFCEWRILIIIVVWCGVVQEMTLEEYEKVLEEKRKALDAEKNEERKVEADKAFASMQLVDNKKREEDIFIKLVSLSM